MNKQHYALAFAFDNFDVIKAIFGDMMAGFIADDVFKEIGNIKQQLLTRYDVTERCVFEDSGFCYTVFSSGDATAFVDFNEQYDVILSSGRNMIRSALISLLGVGSGRNIGFSLVIVKIDDTQDKIGAEALIHESLQNCEPHTTHIEDDQPSPNADITRSQFLEVLRLKAIETHFQSIVALPSGDTVGYEALTRGLENSPVRRADQLFGSATFFGLNKELELLCIESAMDWVPAIPEPNWVSINVSPALLLDDAFHALIRQPKYTAFHHRLVFELTEHLPLDNANAIRSTAIDLNELGIKLSLDDTGCGFFDLHTVEALRPAIVKLCITVIQRLDRKDEVADEILQTRKRIDELNGVTLGEGVETEEQRTVLEHCGVQLAQGYLFAKPEAAKHLFPPP